MAIFVRIGGTRRSATRNLNSHSRKFLPGSRNGFCRRPLTPTTNGEEEQMRKLTYALVAAATLAIGAPTIANAASLYIGGDDGYYGYRHEAPGVRVYPERGWHHGWYRHDRDYYDRGVVIRPHHWDD
jgi:hypothetical protein